MGSEVKFRYGENIKSIADSRKEQGTFYYDKNTQRLYLYTPAGAADTAIMVPIGQSIIKVSSIDGISYDENSFYLDDSGKIYYYNSQFLAPKEIALMSNIDSLASSLTDTNNEITLQITTVNTKIETINNEIGDPAVIGKSEATGLYSYIDNLESKKADKVNYYTKSDIDNTISNYYTKDEAETKFLSADEDLFLVKGSVQYGTLNDDGAWIEATKEFPGTPHIVLELKNNTDNVDSEDVKTIYIPATDLVDVYTGVDTNTVDMTINGLSISADVKSAGFVDNNTIVAKNNIIEVNPVNIISNPTDAEINLKIVENKIQAELSKSTRDTINSLVESNNITLINNNATNIIKNQEAIQAHIEELNAYKDIVGSYEFGTTDEEKSLSYFEQVKNHIDAETAERNTAIGNEAQAREQADEAESQARINGDNAEKEAREIAINNLTNYNTTNIGTYKWENNTATATGTYFTAVQNHIDYNTIDLQGKIDNVSIAVNNEESRATSAEATLLNKIEEIYVVNTDENNVSIEQGKLPATAAAIREELSAKENALKELINTNKSEHDNYVQSNNAALAAEVNNREILADDIGTYSYSTSTTTSEDGTETTIVTVAAPSGYFAEVKEHIEAEVTAIREELAGNVNDSSASMAGIIAELSEEQVARSSEDNRLQGLIEEIYKVTIENEQSSVTGLLPDETTARIASDENLQEQINTANGLIQNNTEAVNTIQATINNTDTGLTKAHEKVDALTIDFNKAINLTVTENETSFTGGLVKEYIDEKDSSINGKINNIEANYATKNYVDITFETKTDANAKFTKTINNDNVSYSGDIYTAYTNADMALETKIAQAYNEADQALEEKITKAYQAVDTTLTIENIEIYVPSEDDESNSLTKDKTYLKITYADDNHIKYYNVDSLLTIQDANLNNYYTKDEAETKFLSADEDLFLTDGYLQKGKIVDNEYQADESGEYYIVLVLRNIDDANTEGKKITIPASTLVNDYSAATAIDAITVTVSPEREIGATLSVTNSNCIELTNDASGLKATLKTKNSNDIVFTKDTDGVSANLSSDILNNIQQGINAFDGDTYVNTFTLNALPKDSGELTNFEINLGQSGNKAPDAFNLNLLTPLEQHLTAKQYVNESRLSGALDSYTNTTGMNNAINAACKELYDPSGADNNKGTIGNELTSINNLISALQGADVGINQTLSGVGTYKYTGGANNTYGSATANNGSFKEVKSHIDALKIYIDTQDSVITGLVTGLQTGQVATNTTNIGNIGSATKNGDTFTSSGYLQILYNQTATDNNTLSSTLIGSTSDTSSSNTIYGAKKYSDANKTAAITEAQTKADVAAKTVYNTYTAAGTTDTQYPILGGTQAQSGNTQAVSYSGATISAAGNVRGNKVYGSVWNDYAEYRQTHHKVRPGQCVYEKGDGSLAISYERMMPGANIVSDTFGFAIGETDDCKTPLAVSGRVLAYPYEPKEEYKAGDAVCSGPNGTISKMTRAEIRDYPERIVGTVSEIPTYEVWGSGNVKVNGRIWIKVR